MICFPLTQFSFPQQQIVTNIGNVLQEKYTEKSTSQHPQLLSENLTSNLAEKVILKRGELKPNKKPNTNLENHFCRFKICVWLVI